MKNFFKRNKEIKKPEFVFTTRHIARQTGNGERISGSGNNSGTLLFDTSQYAVVSEFIPSNIAFSGGTNTNATQGVLSGPNPNVLVGLSAGKSVERKAVEPKAVFEEIKRENVEIDFTNLDEKIKVVEERINILKEHLTTEHLQDEHRALFFLKNRRTYLKTQKANPLDWAMTTEEAVTDLCTRYKLRTVPLKQFYTLVPKDGIKEMDRYTKAYKAITGDLPIFELVIKENSFQDKPEEKKEVEKQRKKDRDPILLANSPLGNFMFVLGAFDDEIEVVDEIIYYGK